MEWREGGERCWSARIGVLMVVLVLPLLEEPASRLCPEYLRENHVLDSTCYRTAHLPPQTGRPRSSLPSSLFFPSPSSESHFRQLIPISGRSRYHTYRISPRGGFPILVFLLFVTRLPRPTPLRTIIRERLDDRVVVRGLDLRGTPSVDVDRCPP